jgi:UDP-N-acetylmuramate dehydrogenase
MGFKKNKEEIKRKICEISKKRISSQPQGYPTGGSTFKNYKNYKAWELISKLGVSNLRCGGAMISDLHNNFMINTGNAKASDFENLGEIIIDKVQSQFGIKLEWEIQILGKNGKN